MKKIIICIFVLFFYSCCLAQNLSNAQLSANVTIDINKKDPKLIKIFKVKEINQKSYVQKISSDNKIYQNYKKDISEEYFNLYVILDKLLRANNLYYQNWRLAVNNDIEEVNASAGSINLIVINSSLYDSLYQNKDALAFILSHELAHFVLGHHQISAENNYKIKQLEMQVQKLEYEASKQNTLASLNNTTGDYYSSLGNSFSGLAYSLNASALQRTINNIYKQERELEVKADIEAIAIMTRGGFDIQNGKEALEFLSNLPNIFTNRSSHPPITHRIASIDSEIELLDLNELKNQGLSNILNSKVLEIKKSSDKKTVVISKFQNSNRTVYIPETRESKLLKKAYKYYCNNEMPLAKTYFKDAFVETSANYIPALYLSYIYEYEFLYNKNKKSLKQSAFWARKAFRLAQKDKNAIKQNEDIIELIKKMKLDKKQQT